MSFPTRSIRSRSIAPLIALSTFALFGCSEESATPLAPRIDAPQFSVAQTGLTSTGWQERARQLVAAGSLSPMAAGRAYALLGVAQYAAHKATPARCPMMVTAKVAAPVSKVNVVPLPVRPQWCSASCSRAPPLHCSSG